MSTRSIRQSKPVHTGAAKVVEAAPRGEGTRVAVVCARFNDEITSGLLTGALEALRDAGVAESDTSVVWVPGAFEIPLVAQQLAGSGEVDAVVALGAVIRGETGHYEHVAGQAAAGLQRVALDTSTPVAFGVLTTENEAQAVARSRADEQNKGAEAANAALETLCLLRELRGVVSAAG